jgi:hypothetical protein
VRQDEDAVDVHDHLPARVRRRVTGQLPDMFAYFGPGHAERGQNPLPSCGQSADQAGDRRIGGHRPEHGRLRPQHAHIGKAVPAQRDREGDVQEDLPRVMDGPVLAPRGERGGHRLIKAGLADRLHQQHGPCLRDHSAAADLDTDMRVRPDTLLHLGSASFLAANRILSKSYRCRSGALPVFLIKPRTGRFVKARG